MEHLQGRGTRAARENEASVRPAKRVKAAVPPLSHQPETQAVLHLHNDNALSSRALQANSSREADIRDPEYDNLGALFTVSVPMANQNELAQEDGQGGRAGAPVAGKFSLRDISLKNAHHKQGRAPGRVDLEEQQRLLLSPAQLMGRVAVAYPELTLPTKGVLPMDGRLDAAQKFVQGLHSQVERSSSAPLFPFLDLNLAPSTSSFTDGDIIALNEENKRLKDDLQRNNLQVRLVRAQLLVSVQIARNLLKELRLRNTRGEERRTNRSLCLSKVESIASHKDITQGEQGETRARVDDTERCISCMENGATVVALPCRHLVLCSLCSDICNSCPRCGMGVKAVLHVQK